MNFSQRQGILSATNVIQRESMEQALRNSLWNVATIHFWDRHSYTGRSHTMPSSNLYPLIRSLWADFYKAPYDTIPSFWQDTLKQIRKAFMDARWNRVYDFMEFLGQHRAPAHRGAYYGACNSILTRENAAYRFVSGQVTEITSQEEVESIEKAITESGHYAGVKTHLTAALTMLSNRENPSYRNSIKESISAVESLAKQISGNDDGTLGAVLKALENAKRLHPAMSKAFSALYGYTSSAKGIRHALMEEENLTKADATFMLVCCSAFVNYCIEAVASQR